MPDSRTSPNAARVGDDWAIITEYPMSAPSRFVRQMAVFVRQEDGLWRRDDERHDNVLVDTTRIPALLAEHGVRVEVREAFGSEKLPVGLRAVVGLRVDS